ncbi:hypothetical protein M378DRAFT_225005 [Amanita muscaria Koide BX008]|uniref:Uncharacterized protein n=1 Tax=Amanita muscaria (strain Koide BX008) TaxID=946122 RepID=A0A0C2XQQ3_AMAMK|nr:hypothetical protein M378DRAFT_225005 [Amanita muscaria Koide BX008]
MIQLDRTYHVDSPWWISDKKPTRGAATAVGLIYISPDRILTIYQHPSQNRQNSEAGRLSDCRSTSWDHGGLIPICHPISLSIISNLNSGASSQGHLYQAARAMERRG